MKRIVFLTPQDARCGFSLTGVRQIVTRPDRLQEDLNELTEDHDIGVLVIDERLTGETTPERLRQIEARWPGVIVVLPGPEEAAVAEEDYAMRLIRRAIGYQVRLRL